MRTFSKHIRKIRKRKSILTPAGSKHTHQNGERLPCIVLEYNNNSVDLDTPEVVKNQVDIFIPVLSNHKTKYTTHDTTTLTWDGITFIKIKKNERCKRLFK